MDPQALERQTTMIPIKRLNKNENVRNFVKNQLHQKRNGVSLSRIDENGKNPVNGMDLSRIDEIRKEPIDHSPNKIDSHRIRGFKLKSKYEVPFQINDISQPNQFKAGLFAFKIFLDSKMNEMSSFTRRKQSMQNLEFPRMAVDKITRHGQNNINAKLKNINDKYSSAIYHSNRNKYNVIFLENNNNPSTIQKNNNRSSVVMPVKSETTFLDELENLQKNLKMKMSRNELETLRPRRSKNIG
jgi:hypothetical protein